MKQPSAEIRKAKELVSDKLICDRSPLIFRQAKLLAGLLEETEPLDNVVSASNRIAIARAGEQAMKEENAGLMRIIRLQRSKLTS